MHCVETSQARGLLEGIDEDKNVVHSNTNDDKERDQVEQTNCIDA